MLDLLKRDFAMIFERDPAARNGLEVLLCSPGLQAIVLHRFAHLLALWGLPVIPRLVSHLSRFLTGVEIHPGAQIGPGTCIDHGMGVVIGETAIIGQDCLIYQGVTLGGTGKQTGKRHPTLGENVVVGAGAKVLGNITIGDNVRIGAGSVVLRDVPADCTVVGVPGRIVYRSGAKVNPLEHGCLPDSEAQAMRALLDRIETLEESLQQVQTQLVSQREEVVAVQREAAHSAARSAELCRSVGTETRRSSLGSAEPVPAIGRPCEELTLADWERMAAIMAEVRASAEREAASAQGDHSADRPGHRSSSCRLGDRVLEEFFDGAGI